MPGHTSRKKISDNGHNSLSVPKTMDDGHYSSSVPKTTVDEHNSSKVFQTTDNRLHSSSEPSDSGHHEDATQVDNALLRRGGKRVKRDGTVTNWSSAAVGNILGESAPTPTENVPTSTERASAKASDAPLPSFYASMSPKLPKDAMPQADPEKGRPTDIMPQADPAKGRPTDIQPEHLPPVTQAQPVPSGSNPFLKDNQCKNFWPKNLVQLARDVTNLPSSRPANMEFKFLLDKESAQRNFCILQKYKFDLTKALKAQENSPLSYGSEFKSTKVLSLIFALHPNWKRMKHILENGSCWPLDRLPTADRQNDLEEALIFGNHKGAEKNPKLLKELVEKDVTHGYGLVLPLEKLKRIPGTLLAPMNVMKQNSIDECGRIVEKDRLTHDQSYK